MQKLLFSHIVAGFFVSLFLLGIIICVVFILYTLSVREPEKGKSFMHFFSVRYFREITDGGELKKKYRVYRLAPTSGKKSVPRKKTRPRTATKKPPAIKTANGQKSKRTASVSQRIYFVNGKPYLQKPKENLKVKV